MTLVETQEPAIEQVRVRVLPDGRLTRKDAAKYLGRAEKTLAMWEMEAKGPRSVLVGGRRFEAADARAGQAGEFDGHGLSPPFPPGLTFLAKCRKSAW